MINSFTSLLRRIVGRIKMWTSLIAQFGSVFTTMGVVMLIYTFQYAQGWKSTVGTLCGMLFVLVGFLSLWVAIKMAGAESRDNDKKFDELINEIRGVRDNLNNKGGNDDSSNDKRNPRL